MRSRLDTITRLVAHSAAVFLFILIWMSAEPKAPTVTTLPDVVPTHTISSADAEPKATASTPIPLVWEATPDSGSRINMPDHLNQSEPVTVSPGTAAMISPVEPAPALPVPESVPEIKTPSEAEGHKLELVVPDETNGEPTQTAQVDATLPASSLPDQVAVPEQPTVTAPAISTEISPSETAPTEPTPEKLPDSGSPVVESPVEIAPSTQQTEETTVPLLTPDKSAPSEVSPEPVTPSDPTAETAPKPLDVQPDESGSMVIAEGTAKQPEAAALPLPKNGGMEVIGDGIYWLGTENSPAENTERLPAGTRWLYLVPEADSIRPDSAPVSADSIPATGDSLNEDGVERFLRGVQVKPGESAAIAVLPGAWGALYFKGAYLMVVRGIGLEDTLIELAHDLDQTNQHRDEIVHRLRRLDTAGLKSRLFP